MADGKRHKGKGGQRIRRRNMKIEKSVGAGKEVGDEKTAGIRDCGAWNMHIPPSPN